MKRTAFYKLNRYKSDRKYCYKLVEKNFPTDTEIEYPIVVNYGSKITTKKYYYYYIKGKVRVVYVSLIHGETIWGRYILLDGSWSAPTEFFGYCFEQGKSRYLPPFLADETWVKEVSQKRVLPTGFEPATSRLKGGRHNH